MVSSRLTLAIALLLTAACASTNDVVLGDAGEGAKGDGTKGGGGSVADSAGGAPDDSGVGANGGPDGATAAGDSGGNDGGAARPGDASADACATALFCENFESYTAGKAPGGPWKISTSLGAVAVATDQRFDGQNSAKFTTQAGSAFKTAHIQLDAASVFPVPGNMVFGRMMSRLESAPDQSVHWTFIEGDGLVPGQSYHALYRYGGQQPVTADGGFVGSQLMANYDTPDSYSQPKVGPSSDCWNHAKGTVIPVGRWACVEWQFDGPNNTMRFWLDGAPVDSLTVVDKGQGCVNQPATFPWTAPSFASLELGWESYQMDVARTLYLDDIVIATERVGCPAPPP
jgi:hypothetical protein